MVETDASMKDVAMDAGFRSDDNFYKAFARVEGIFYEVDDRWASAREIETLLRAAGFTRFAKYGRGHHYDVLATRS